MPSSSDARPCDQHHEPGWLHVWTYHASYLPAVATPDFRQLTGAHTAEQADARWNMRQMRGELGGSWGRAALPLWLSDALRIGIQFSALMQTVRTHLAITEACGRVNCLT